MVSTTGVSQNIFPRENPSMIWIVTDHFPVFSWLCPWLSQHNKYLQHELWPSSNHSISRRRTNPPSNGPNAGLRSRSVTPKQPSSVPDPFQRARLLLPGPDSTHLRHRRGSRSTTPFRGLTSQYHISVSRSCKCQFGLAAHISRLL